MGDPSRIGFQVLLDANVAAKPVTRTLLMAAGALSGYAATWSAYAEDEADRHTRPGQEAASGVRALAGGDLAPAGENPERFAATSAKDRQVLADAVAAEALFIVTEDVDDFGEADLRSVGMAAVNPDLFLSVRASRGGYARALGLMAARFGA
jgi:hypothetical protein